MVEYFSYFETQVIMSFVKQGLSSKEISNLLNSDEDQIIKFLKENNLIKVEEKGQGKKSYDSFMSEVKGTLRQRRLMQIK